MINFIFSLIFGTKNQRDLRKLRPIVEKIEELAPSMAALSDEELKSKTAYFREKLSQGATLDDILIEAFAVVREVAKRTIKLYPFPVQLMGGIVLHQGKIAEMKTGEGKTLVATMPAYLNALTGKGVHVVTVNDYLAKRDRYWMGPIYEFLGLTVGYIQHSMSDDERKKMYNCDITYVTNTEVGFDYLRDNMKLSKEEQVLRGLNYAIVDEVDSILIDEARTPLIISGPAEESTEKYYIINRIVPYLKGKFVTDEEEIEAKRKGIDISQGYDYLVDEKNNNVILTEAGIKKCERLLNIENLYNDIQSEWVHHITQALRAHNLYKRDVDYVVKDGEVVIVDEFTGRLMPGRRWSEGLHQAIEAKEGLRITEENQTLATITYQNFFRLYNKLAGMTGTAATEADEFWQIYKLDVVVIPTNRPMIRKDYPDVIYKTEREKFNAIINDIENCWKRGQPVLVGTRSIEKSERLAALLRSRGIPCNVLNAKYHEKEAEIIAQAGRKYTVTIATNMAGRGTDIILGGNPPDPKEAEEVKNLGGLYVIGTERHEARRIDNQLRGRSGRQGDPGCSRFYISLEDELMRLFGSDRIKFIMEKLGMQEGEPIEHPLITKAIENAQKRVEAMHFDIRKQLLEYDNVMNKQREVVYALRNKILEGEDVSERIKEMINENIENIVSRHTARGKYPEQWDWDSMAASFKRIFFGVDIENIEEKYKITKASFIEKIREKVFAQYEKVKEEFGEENFKNLERFILLHVIDNCWKDHLYDIDQLRKSVGLRAYGQRDPLVEYKREAYNLFMSMLERISRETVEYLFHMRPITSQGAVVSEKERLQRRRGVAVAQVPVGVIVGMGSSMEDYSEIGNRGDGNMPKKSKISNKVSSENVGKKIGRNDPCPCGSGKKYKKCCMLKH
jgi:preprotein translocase subunit SecA